MNVHMLLGRAAVAAVFVGAAAMASAQNTQNGGIDYDTAREGRRLKATQAQGPIALDGRLDEPSWAAADRKSVV